MAENWNAIALEIKAALQEVGFPVIHRRVSASAGPNAWTPGVPSNSDTTVTILQDSFSLKEIDGTVVKAGDRKDIMEAATVTPIVGDYIVIAGKPYRILALTPLAPGGTSLLFEVHSRA